jgi:hypothetical protein
VLTSREAASLVIVGVFVVAVALIPKLRRSVVPHTRPLLRRVFDWRLVVVCALVLAVAAISITLAWWIGLWEWSLLKDAIFITATVVLPMTFRSLAFPSGGSLASRLLKETLGLASLLTLYLDAAPLPLWGELLLQPLIIVLVMLQAFARADVKYTPARKVFDALLALIGLFLLGWTTTRLITVPPDWLELLRSVLFNFWLPLTLFPFFYVFGFYARTETLRSRFRALKTPLRPRVFLAVLIGTRLRLSLLARFSGRYNNVGRATEFRDALRRMAHFREDLERRDAEEAQRLAMLKVRAGALGVDADGCHLDRREFHETKSRLDWIWTCQNGQWERQGGRYWDHLTDLIVDAEKHGLPAAHGFTVEVAQQGQVFRAWRQTPGGAVLGTGGRERRSQYYFQGDAPPERWPGESEEWVNAATSEWPPDWNRSDASRL